MQPPTDKNTLQIKKKARTRRAEQTELSENLFILVLLNRHYRSHP